MYFADPDGRWSAFACTHVGKVRVGNEDSFGARPERGAFVVCDGMGGAAAGEIASRVAVEAFLEAAGNKSVNGKAQPEEARAAVRAAHQAVQNAMRADETRRGMGTTLVALLLDADGQHALVVHAGDSRCYRFRGGELEALTLDHSFVEEQVRRGQMTLEEAKRSPLRHVITRAIGSSPEPSVPDVNQVEIAPGDLYLLCSDGLTRELPDARIREILQQESGAEAGARALVSAAVEAGGRDNITALLVNAGP